MMLPAPRGSSGHSDLIHGPARLLRRPQFALLAHREGLNLEGMPEEQLAEPVCLDDYRGRAAARTAAGLVTIADVAAACGLPQPVVAQLVPRVWTDRGWMYSCAALEYAVQISEDVRAGRPVAPLVE